KSRLAVHVAAGLADTLRDGALHADLSSADDADAAAQAVLRAAGGRELPACGLVESLVRHLRDAELLLGLGGGDRGVGPAGELAAAVLARCPHIRVLATGARRLGVDGEEVHALGPLGLPPESGPEETRRSEASLLFEQRAGPGFRLDEGTA